MFDCLMELVRTVQFLSGVPQDTVLGPLLFISIISVISKDVTSSGVISFADDTRVTT